MKINLMFLMVAALIAQVASAQEEPDVAEDKIVTGFVCQKKMVLVFPNKVGKRITQSHSVLDLKGDGIRLDDREGRRKNRIITREELARCARPSESICRLIAREDLLEVNQQIKFAKRKVKIGTKLSNPEEVMVEEFNLVYNPESCAKANPEDLE